MHISRFKKPQTKKKHDYFQFTLSRQQEMRVKHHQDLVLGLQGFDYQVSTTTSKTQLDQLQSQFKKALLKSLLAKSQPGAKLICTHLRYSHNKNCMDKPSARVRYFSHCLRAFIDVQ